MNLLRQKKIGILYMITSCLFFSILAGLIKFIGNEIHAFQQAFFRNIFSIILIGPLVLYSGINIFKTNKMWLLLLRSLFGSLTMVLLFLSYTLIPLSQAITISFTTPLFIFLGGIIFFKEKASIFKVLALLFGFLFTIIALNPTINISFGCYIGLLAAIFHAIAALIVKELTKTESVLSLMFFMVLFMSIFTLIPALFYWEIPEDKVTWFYFLLLALVGTLGNYFWTSALSKSDVTEVMPYDFTKLVFASLIGLFFFNEQLEIRILISGIGIIVCNLILTKSLK